VSATYDPRLYNDDIAPRTEAGNWRTWDLFSWWMSAWHSLGTYTTAVGFLVFGLAGWTTVAAIAFGMLVMLVMSNLSGIAGQRVGVPFPVFARISFGVYGANLPAILRAVVAVAWYGIQTYLASTAVMILVLKLVPGAEGMAGTSFLGLSALGWVCFLALWTVQLAVLWRGMEMVRKISDFAGTSIWVAMIALMVWVLHRAGWTVDLGMVSGPDLDTGGSVLAFFGIASLICAQMSGPMLNFCDFTRMSPDARNVTRGNLLGLGLNGVGFALVAIVIGLASAEVYGEAVSDPVHMLADIDSVTLLLVAIIAVGIATVGINVILNFVSPAYDFANIAPRYIDFRTGGIITAVLALLVMPWKLYANTTMIVYFLGGIGAMMGPLLGIVLVDYYVVRRGHVVVDDLFTADERGAYHYTRGVSRPAVASFAIGSAIALVAAYWGDLGLGNFSWPIGVVAGALARYLIFVASGRPTPPAGRVPQPRTEGAPAVHTTEAAVTRP